MKRYHLELRKRDVSGDVVIKKIIVPSEDNMTALITGQIVFEDKIKERGYEILDCGMFVGSDVIESDIFIRNEHGETVDLYIRIIKIVSMFDK